VFVRVVTGDWSALQAVVQQGSATALTETLRAQFQSNTMALVYLFVSPLLLALLAALLGTGQSTGDAAPATPQAEPKKPGEDALRLLRALQEEARFVDFI